MFVILSANAITNDLFINFGQDSVNVASANADANGLGTFEYAPPTDYVCLAASSLSEPTISPNSAIQADDYFNTVLYTGDGTSSNAITGVGFQPDFLWIKQRSPVVRGHQLMDSVRGASVRLQSHGGTAESASALVSFDSDGFTVDGTTLNGTNANGDTFVAWNWKAGGTAVSNTDGSITSQVSAAPDAGFSICTYTGTSTVSESFGHGLNQAPELVITKARNSSDDWRVHGSVLGTDKFLTLSGTNAVATDSSNGGFPDNTDTLVNLGYESTNGTNYVAYCFHSSDTCKVGSYVGNGNADGTFVFTGFRPAFILTKESSSTSGWNLRDSVRSPENVVNEVLQADTNGAEMTSNYDVDFLSNGFKLRTSLSDSNTNGQTYIYLAFAEAPFKYANAR